MADLGIRVAVAAPGIRGESSCSIGHMGALRKRRHLGVLWKRGHLGEKSMVNPIWPLRLKRISRIAIWIGFQTTYECSSKQIYTNQISCSSLLIRLSKYDQICSNIHKNQIWADSLNKALKCIMLQKIYMISVQFFLTFYSLKNPDKMYHGFHKNIKQHNHFATVSYNITFYCIFIGKKGSLCEHKNQKKKKKNLAPGYLYYCAILTEADNGSSRLFSEQLSGVSCVMGSWALSSCCSRSEHSNTQPNHALRYLISCASQWFHPPLTLCLRTTLSKLCRSVVPPASSLWKCVLCIDFIYKKMTHGQRI